MIRIELDPRAIRDLRAALQGLGGEALLATIKTSIQAGIKDAKRELVAAWRRDRANRGIAVDQHIRIGRFWSRLKRGYAWGAVGVLKRGMVEMDGQRIPAWRAARRVEEGYTRRGRPVPARPFARPVYARLGPNIHRRVVEAIRRFIERGGAR